MDVSSARALKPGDRIVWQLIADPIGGTVRQATEHAVYVEWDDEQWSWVYHEGTAMCIRREPENKTESEKSTEQKESADSPAVPF